MAAALAVLTASKANTVGIGVEKCGKIHGYSLRVLMNTVGPVLIASV